MLVVTETLGENATLSYDLYYDGDITEGTVTYTDGNPVFTPANGTGL